MTGFSSHADFMLETTANQKKFPIDFNRTIDTGATTAAGRWHGAFTSGGTGGAMTLTGTAGVGIVMTRSTAGALPLNANVSTDTRHIQSGYAMTSSATVAPATVLLTDIIHIYPSCVVVTTPTSLSNHPTWTGTGDTRMTNAVGVQLSAVLTTAGTVAGTLNFTYLDQDGNSANTAGIQGTSLHSVVAAHPSGCFLASGAATTGNNGGLFMPLVAGDTGVQRVSSYTITTGITSGLACLILHRPICYLPIGIQGGLTLVDYYQMGLPRIYDDSCLGLITMVGGATTTAQTIQGQIFTGWG
jgi:hypothetical protein